MNLLSAERMQLMQEISRIYLSQIEDLNLDDAVRFTRKLEDYADKRSIDLEMKRVYLICFD